MKGKNYMYNEYDDELYHFGIKGMHWGVRRFQNENGSLTSAGKSRYATSKGDYKAAKKAYKERVSGINAKVNKETNKQYNTVYNKSYNKKIDRTRRFGTAAYAGSAYALARMGGMNRKQAALLGASAGAGANIGARIGARLGKRTGKEMLRTANKVRNRSEYKSAKKDFKSTQAYKDQRSRRLRTAAKVGGAALAVGAAAGAARYKHNALHPKNYSDMTVDVTKAFKRANGPYSSKNRVPKEFRIGRTRRERTRDAFRSAGSRMKSGARSAGSRMKSGARSAGSRMKSRARRVRR